MTIEVIKKSGHQVVDEQPEIVAGLIERYASARGDKFRDEEYVQYWLELDVLPATTSELLARRAI